MDRTLGFTFEEGDIIVNEGIYSNFDLVEAEKEESPDEDDVIKCGDVYLVRNENFVLICGFCNTAFDDVNEFGEHIIAEHVNGCEDDACCTDEGHSVTKPQAGLDTADDTEDMVSVIFQMDDGLDVAQTPGCDSKPVKNRNDRNKSPNASATGEPVIRFTQRQPIQRDPNLYCKQCDRRYQRKSLLDAHNEYKHNKPRPCEFCLKTFVTTRDLYEHTATHSSDQSYLCPKCPKTFTTRHYRNEHISGVHERVKKFKCPHCPMSFSVRPTLTVHLLQHAVPGEYSCEICSRQFVYKGRMIAHMRIHTGERPYQCETCGKNFNMRSRLTEHMKRHLNRKDHECKDCGKRFYSNVLLKYHAVAHSSEKPFKCADCGRGFSRLKTLKTHRLIHAPVKKYSCHICDRKFAQRPGLTSHLKTHKANNGD